MRPIVNCRVPQDPITGSPRTDLWFVGWLGAWDSTELNRTASNQAVIR
jgi:hypothetical protein